MTIAWRTTLAALDTAIAGATDIDAEIGPLVRRRLNAIGLLYDTRYPPAPAPARPSVRTESAEHVAWRDAMDAAIVNLDEIAALADGEVPASGAGDLDFRRDQVLKRLEASLQVANPSVRPFVEHALKYRFPSEPWRFFVSEYYEGGGRYTKRQYLSYPNWEYVLNGIVVAGPSRQRIPEYERNYQNDGALEEALVDALASANAYLSVV